MKNLTDWNLIKRTPNSSAWMNLPTRSLTTKKKKQRGLKGRRRNGAQIGLAIGDTVWNDTTVIHMGMVIEQTDLMNLEWQALHVSQF